MITEYQIQKVFNTSFHLAGNNYYLYENFLKENNLYTKRNYNLLKEYASLYFYTFLGKNPTDINFNKLITELYRYHKLKYIIDDN